jgi:hypothetical protein
MFRFAAERMKALDERLVYCATPDPDKPQAYAVVIV